MITAEYLEEQEYKKFIEFYNHIKNADLDFVEGIYWKGISYLTNHRHFLTSPQDTEIYVRICRKVLKDRGKERIEFVGVL